MQDSDRPGAQAASGRSPAYQGRGEPVKVTAFVSHEDCPRHDTGWSHPDHQGRLPALVRAVQKDMVALWDPLLQVEAEPASEAELRLVHTQRYIDDVRRTAIAAAAEGRTLELGGVPVSGASFDAALAAVGGAITAIETVFRGEARNVFVVARPPGRGAGADAPGEFSLFNTVAIAARHLRERHGSARVLVVAWGARPATALRRALAGDPGVSVLSLHRRPEDASEAGAGAGDVPLAPGTDGAAFEAALRDALNAIPLEESPDFVLLSAGFDILAGDPQGGLAVDPRAIHPITLTLRDWADARAGGRLVSVLEGGYEANATAKAVVQHLRALAGVESA
ncbi:MAG TPA: histone deacetylase [Longimicrobium sp.]|nr:histone deacetylase [Longimicrobium sp.]